MALEFNPARLQDESTKKVFSLIGEAYDVLSNPLRRAVFDQYGEEGLKRGVPGPKDYIHPYCYHGDPMRTYKYTKTQPNPPSLSPKLFITEISLERHRLMQICSITWSTRHPCTTSRKAEAFARSSPRYDIRSC